MEMQKLKQEMSKEERFREMPIDELVREIQKDPEAVKQAKELLATY